MLGTHHGFFANHTLGQQVGERFFEFNQSLIMQHPRIKSRIEQVQDSMLDPADVLVNGHPVINGTRVKHVCVTSGAAVSFEIPG